MGEKREKRESRVNRTRLSALSYGKRRKEDYIACKAGYRAAYICDAVQQVLSDRLDLHEIAGLSDEALIEALERVQGVGDKVANCIALFAYGRTACAPADTWIKKIIEQNTMDRILLSDMVLRLESCSNISSIMRRK